MKEVFKNFISDVKSLFFEFINQNDFWKKFAFVYGTYFIGILSLLQANYLYKTDLSRVAALPTFGAWDWGHSGRFFNDLMMPFFHFDFYPQDISPLSELLALIFLSFASIILVHVVCKKMTYPRLFFSVIVGLSPYYLQVLSYVFDCLFYSIGIFIAVLPFLWYKRDRTFYLMSAICLLFCYMIFQSIVSIYMVLVTYMFWKDYQDEQIPLKSLIYKILTTVSVFLSVSLFYYILIHITFTGNSDALKQSAICSWTACPTVFAENFDHATNRYFFKHWRNTPMGYAFIGVLLSFLVYVLYQAYQNKRTYPRAVHIFVALSTIFLMLFFIILWTMFFTFIYWNARIWAAFGICFATMMLATTNEDNKIMRRIFMTTSFILMWGCIVFANRVGNLLEIQKRYESFVFFTLAQDLTKFPHKDLIFDFKPISSPVVKSKAKQYPVIRDLVTALQPKYNRFNYYFIRFYRPDIKICRDQRQKMNKVVLKNAHHKFIQINNNCLKVYFR